MHKYALKITYDGTTFCGWQIQPNGPSIQAHLQEALCVFLKHPTWIVGAGRTDAGVHALAQIAHFETPQILDPLRAIRALNHLLPPSIRVKALVAVDESFHARFSAVGKEYHYHLWTQEGIDPFVRPYRTYFRRPFSLPLLKEAAKHFQGKRDFSTFTNLGTPVKSTVRTIHRLDIVPQDGGLRLEFEGDGFLYKMVRNIVGTLLEIATEKRSIHTLPSLFEKRDRRLGGIAAPASGLFLVRVIYQSELFSTLPAQDL